MTTLERESKLCDKIVDTISTTFVGKRTIIRKMVAGALANGHILFEDYPGLGKTLLVKAFARSIGVNFNRVQFTPDVLPSDILGTKIWDQKASNFKMSKGPIFTNILLADEINRSPPKTQSALLEAMEEHQVTIEGETMKLEAPFFVLATQNPIEQEGSLGLDEAVLLDGRLRTGRDLLSAAREPLFEDKRGIRLYDLRGKTVGLDVLGRLQSEPCLLYTLPHDGDLIEVKTRTGRTIRVTPNHPFLVNDRGTLRWVRADALDRATFLVQPARLPNLPDATFPSHEATLGRMAQRPIPREIPLDEDFAFWIAFLLSDGSIGESAVEAVQKNYPEALDRWIAISASYGFRPRVRVKAGVRHARFYSKPLVEYLRLRFGVLHGRAKEIPLSFVGLAPPLAKEFLRTFVCLESSLRDNRIVFTQKSRRNTDVISWLLLRHGIVSWHRHDGRVWRLKIQGADTIRFLKTLGWIDPRRAAVIATDRRIRSTHRVVPVEPRDIVRMVELLGVASFHTLPGRTRATRRPWYGSYVGIKKGKHVTSVEGLRALVEDLSRELAGRTTQSPPTGAATRSLAAGFGLSMVDIAKNLGLSHNQVWGLYQGAPVAATQQIVDYVTLEAGRRRLEVAQLLAYYRTLLSEDVLYDRVVQARRVPGTGRVFGLTVPRNRNYLAGFGACGINHNTYPLPEAQLDRFMLKMSTGYPENEQLEAEILNRRISWQRDDPTQDIKPLISGASFRDLQRIVETKIFIHKELLLYISKLVRGLRAHAKVQVGPSPRGSLALLKASRAMALMNGRDYVSPDDVKLFVYECLSHRTLLAVEHVLDGLTSPDVVREVLQSVPVPTRFLESQPQARAR